MSDSEEESTHESNSWESTTVVTSSEESESRTTTTTASSASFENMPDMPFHEHLFESDISEELEKYIKLCEEYWENEKTVPDKKINPRRRALHLNTRARPFVHYRYFLKKCSKQREKGDKTPSEKSPAAPKASKSVSNTSSETNRDSQSSFSAPSLFEGELTDNSSDVDENRSLNNIQIELDQKEIVFQNETKLTISMKPLKMDLTDWYQPEPATKEELAMFETTPDLNESSC